MPFEFRNLMLALADRWRLLAPDFPGFGYSGTPEPSAFDYTFDGYGAFLIRFTEGLGVAHWPTYEALTAHWANPTPEGREKLTQNVSEDGFRAEFLGELPERLVDRGSPDLWKLSWPLMKDGVRREIVAGIFEAQATTLAGFSDIQSYLWEHQPPTLIVWGPHDGYMPQGSARAYLRDLPNVELHLLDGGQWALETNLDEIVVLIRDVLGRVHSSSE